MWFYRLSGYLSETAGHGRSIRFEKKQQVRVFFVTSRLGSREISGAVRAIGAIIQGLVRNRFNFR